MQLINAIKVAIWLDGIWPTYLDYLEDGDRQPYDGDLSGDWDSGEKIRVSKIGNECPKYNAAKALGLTKRKEITRSDRIKFEDAKRRAEQIYEAIAWGCTTNNFITFDAERRIEEHWSGLAGTIDGVIGFNGMDGKLNNKNDRQEAPIEVKRTDANKFKKNPSGISLGNFYQTIGEMILLSKTPGEYGECNTGFVYTTYSWDSEPTHKVWIIRWDEDKQGWRLLNTRIHELNEWPRDMNGDVFISVQAYMNVANGYSKWMEWGKNGLINELNPYGSPFESWHCGKEVPAEYYKTNSKWGDKGDLKDGTGIYIKRCPMFDRCWKNFKYVPERAK